MKQPKSNQQSRPINTRADDTANPQRPFGTSHLAACSGFADGWHDFPGTTRLRGTGCYAYLIDSDARTDVVIFQATGAAS